MAFVCWLVGWFYKVLAVRHFLVDAQKWGIISTGQCVWLAGGWSGAKDGPYAWGLCYNQELAPEKDYCKTDLLYPCAPGAGYYGRGAFPLYWYVCCLLSVYGLC